VATGRGEDRGKRSQPRPGGVVPDRRWSRERLRRGGATPRDRVVVWAFRGTSRRLGQNSSCGSDGVTPPVRGSPGANRFDSAEKPGNMQVPSPVTRRTVTRRPADVTRSRVSREGGGCVGAAEHAKGVEPRRRGSPQPRRSPTQPARNSAPASSWMRSVALVSTGYGVTGTPSAGRTSTCATSWPCACSQSAMA
jgi:hypothetical protein